jgi:hypothetical protein
MDNQLDQAEVKVFGGPGALMFNFNLCCFFVK